MNRYVKLFLAAGIPFGIFMGIFQSLQHGLHWGLRAGVLGGLFFGAFMSLILVFLHSRSVKRISPENSEEASAVHHIRNVELRLPYDKAFDLCAESLREIKKCKIQDENRPEGQIVARAGMTWKSWGDAISIKMLKDVDGEIRVEISSRPAVRTTLVDYGKNLENVEKIVGFLNAYSQSAA